jgi:hypothetical protein
VELLELLTEAGSPGTSDSNSGTNSGSGSRGTTTGGAALTTKKPAVLAVRDAAMTPPESIAVPVVMVSG